MRGVRSLPVVAITAILLAALIASVPLAVEAQSDELDPTWISVRGGITDNYVNMTYEIFYDNTASTTPKETSWFFGLKNGVKLSNISLRLGDDLYWGRAEREQEAIEIYNESVEAGETAVLVVSGYGGYQVDLNVENGTDALLTVFIEGMLTRHIGMYSLEIPISSNELIIADFYCQFSIRSQFAPISGYSISGFTGYQATELPDGISIEYSSSDVYLPSGLTIRYALDRQIGGSQLLTCNNGSDNFFLYLLAPSITEAEEQAQRQYVFILDISGSMSGGKLDQAKVAFNSMIDDLSPGDLFNIIAFESEVYNLWDEPHSASAASVAEAKVWVSGRAAGGSTNFHGASMAGLATFTSSDNAKAMLILSDGQPTAGITDSDTILSEISEGNTLGVSISTLAFGYDDNENLMTNIASQNDGFFAFVQPGGDAASQLLDFYNLFSTPVADSYSIEFQGATQISCLRPLDNTPFFNGTEVVVSGRYSEPLIIDTSIDYPNGTESYQNTAGEGSTDMAHIEYAWALHRISYLLDLINMEQGSESLQEEIVNIALYYGIIVRGYTAIILTLDEPEDSHEGEEESTDTTTTRATHTYPATTTGAPWAAPPFAYGTPDASVSLVGGLGLIGLAVIVIAGGLFCRKTQAKQ
ncbi:MAG: VWA domain-containing protein [Candidatus Thorarchaeota archaeon]|jgi:Ca-activated chloride channel family protein